MWKRLWASVLVTVTLTAYLFVGALCGLFLWGIDRWRRRRDWRVLGSLLRILAGGLIGFGLWHAYVRHIDPDPALLLFMLQIGFSVGTLWALIWLVFMQPSAVPKQKGKHDG